MSSTKVITDLDETLFKFVHYKQNTPDDKDAWTLRDAVRGVQIFGGIGSGKSSGSGRELAMAFLKGQFGGIVLTGKIDEQERWKDYAEEADRKDQLICFEPGKEYRFNPLKYELERVKEDGGGYTDNIVSLFMSIMKMGNRADGSGEGGSREPFWLMAMERCIKASVDLLKLAKKAIDSSGENGGHDFELTVANIAKVLRDTPIGEGHYNRFANLTSSSAYSQHGQLKKWAEKSYTVYCLSWASSYIEKAINDNVEKSQQAVFDLESDKRAFDVVSSYFLHELSTLAEKTRSSILEHFFAFATPFRSGLLADYFAGDTSPEIVPEKTFEGKIIVLNFPVKKYLQLGVYAQVIYKKLWQQAVERRKVGKTTRPVFMWIDESQYFINQDDVMFQTTARSSKACTVLISQNISNYYSAIGGQNSKALVDSLLGNLATKIFHNNNDFVTNEWAANTIGQDYQRKGTFGEGGTSHTKELKYQFLPKNFSMLYTGGKPNKDIVEGVVTATGIPFSNGKNYLIVKFKQKGEK